jgi:hypothetical protein
MSKELIKAISSGKNETFLFDPDHKENITRATSKKVLLEIDKQLKSGKKLTLIAIPS